MGRHRRSAAGGDAPRHAPAHFPSGERPIPGDIGPYPDPDAYAEATAKAQAYLFATDENPAPAAGNGSGHDGGSGGREGGPGAVRGRSRWVKAVRPVRAALLGVSVAVVLGTIAVTTGAVPGLEHYRLGGGTHATGGERTGPVASPGNTASEQGGASGSADAAPPAGSGEDGGRRTGRAPSAPAGTSPSGPASPSASVSKPPSATPSPSRTAPGKRTSKSGPARTPATRPAEPAKPSKPSKPAKPSASATPAKPAPEPKPTTPKPTASRTTAPATKAPAPSSTATVVREAAVEAEVLKLVNDERAKAGLGALAANSALTGLAEAFSDDMAARGFFAHTDPDGRTPWDRAARAGVGGLGGENIGRGQADAAAVLAAWMDSPEHRANILDPGFTTFGAGVHLGPGGPWWTLEFGY
ncbi:CAP domain-containing protein [Streptomyces sp. NPDC002343]